MIISQKKTSFLGVVFDVDHDFEGLRAPKAHLDTVKYKPVASPGTPLYIRAESCIGAYRRGLIHAKKDRDTCQKKSACIGHVWAWVRFPPNVGCVFPQMYFVVFGGILMYPSRVRYRCVSKRPSKYTQKTTDTDHKKNPSIGQVLSCIVHVSNGSKLGCSYSHVS